MDVLISCAIAPNHLFVPTGINPIFEALKCIVHFVDIFHQSSSCLSSPEILRFLKKRLCYN
jgi:hypothetical protein